MIENNQTPDTKDLERSTTLIEIYEIFKVGYAFIFMLIFAVEQID